ETRHDIEQLRVELPRVGLTGDGNGGGETDRGADFPFELADLLVIAVEQLEKARLRAGGSLDAATGERCNAMIEVPNVEHQILHPERRALPDGRRLRWLKMRGA